MHSITSETVLARDRNFDAAKFLEPKVTEFNRHTYSKIRHEVQLIKEGLQMHGYPIKKLNCREVWKIGKGDSLYLLSYQLDPFAWVLFPHSENLAQIITHCSQYRQALNTRYEIGDNRSTPSPLPF